VSHQRDLLDELSPSLIKEISDILNRQWVEKVPYIRPEFVVDYEKFIGVIASKLQLHAHAPMEVMLRPGLEVTEMYILDRGAVLIHDTPDASNDAPTQEFGQLFVRNVRGTNLFFFKNVDALTPSSCLQTDIASQSD